MVAVSNEASVKDKKKMRAEQKEGREYALRLYINLVQFIQLMTHTHTNTHTHTISLFLSLSLHTRTLSLSLYTHTISLFLSLSLHTQTHLDMPLAEEHRIARGARKGGLIVALLHG